MRNVLLTAVAASIPLARAHIGTRPVEAPSSNSVLILPRAFYTPAMWGWDVNAEDFPYDNRPETPLQQYTFEQWWFVSVDHSIKPSAPHINTQPASSSAWTPGTTPCGRQLLRASRRWYRHLPVGLQQGRHRLLGRVRRTHRYSSGRLSLPELPDFPVPRKFFSSPTDAMTTDPAFLGVTEYVT